MARYKSVWQAEDGSYHEDEQAAKLHEANCHLAENLRRFIPPEAVGTKHFARAIDWILSEYDRKPPANRPPTAKGPEPIICAEDEDHGYHV